MFFFQFVIAMILVQKVWFAIRQMDNVNAKRMYLDYNVEFVRMVSKIIPTAQVIDNEPIKLPKIVLDFF